MKGGKKEKNKKEKGKFTIRPAASGSDKDNLLQDKNIPLSAMTINGSEA